MSETLFVTHRVSESSFASDSQVGGNAVAIVGTTIVKSAKHIAQNVTAGVWDVEVDVANALVLSLISDQDCSVQGFAGGEAGEILTLVANEALVWDTTLTKAGGAPVEKFLSADVDELKVTTGAIGSAGANLSLLAMK